MPGGVTGKVREGLPMSIITHSLAEAVFLGDRVIVMTPRPGKVSEIVKLDLPRRRTTALRDDPKFISYVKYIRGSLGVL
jgi:NitT/TauT family transport system ATP-binding protein